VADLNEMHVVDVLGASSEWCANSACTVCLEVKGESMRRLIHLGAIVAVDSSQAERSELDGKIVVVSHEEKGITISRFHRYRGVEVLEPENREYESTTLGAGRDWRIIGRVLWWIAKAP